MSVYNGLVSNLILVNLELLRQFRLDYNTLMSSLSALCERVGGREAAGPQRSADPRADARAAAEDKQRPRGPGHSAQRPAGHGVLAAGLQHAQALRPLLLTVPG